MQIVASLAASVFASTLAGAAAPVTSTIPPIAVTVVAAGDVTPALIARMLQETDAVWRAAGITFVWRRDSEAAAARSIAAAPCVEAALHVVIDSGKPREPEPDGARLMPLGWITFDDNHPEPEIHVSYDNAGTYMAQARGVVGLIEQMPAAQRETLMGRVMGRALAHELGHYLLASKVHTARGLMQATHTASDFFTTERSAFAIDAVQRQAIADRLRHAPVVVRR